MSELNDKIENMPEGPDKVQMQERIDGALAIVINDIANLVYFKPKSVDISPVLADLPQEVQDAVNEMVDWKSQEAAKKATYNSQQSGIFENFSKEQQKPADEIVSGYKNKLQSDKAIAAQKKVEAKMKEKSNQTSEEALKTVKLKETTTNKPQFFSEENAQTDFSGVVKDIKSTSSQPSADIFAKKEADPMQTSSQAPTLLENIADGQSNLKKQETGPKEKSTKATIDGSGADVLESAMTERRKAIEGQDEDGETDYEDEDDEFFGQPDVKETPKALSTKYSGGGVSGSTLATNSKVSRMLEQASKK